MERLIFVDDLDSGRVQRVEGGDGGSPLVAMTISSDKLDAEELSSRTRRIYKAGETMGNDKNRGKGD